MTVYTNGLLEDYYIDEQDPPVFEFTDDNDEAVIYVESEDVAAPFVRLIYRHI